MGGVARLGDQALDADTYHVQGRIELALGDTVAGEKALRKALELRPIHEGAFPALLELLRSEKRFGDYKKIAAAYIALDYGNTYPFGVYLEYLARAGLVDADRDLGRELAARSYPGPRDTGAVFFGLGHLAELDSDRALAHEHYTRSLEALRKQDKPPNGAVEAVTELVRRTASQ